jgi:hypothetical protein
MMLQFQFNDRVALSSCNRLAKNSAKNKGSVKWLNATYAEPTSREGKAIGEGCKQAHRSAFMLAAGLVAQQASVKGPEQFATPVPGSWMNSTRVVF